MKTGCVSCECKALDEIWPAENVGASVTERALGVGGAGGHYLEDGQDFIS